MSAHGGRVDAHTIYLDKRLAALSLHSGEAIFALFGKAIAQWIDEKFRDRCDRVVLMFDSALTNRQRQHFLKEVKPVLKTLALDYTISFQPVKEDPCGQVADYVAWAWSRRLERDDERPMRQLAEISQSSVELSHNYVKRLS